MSLSGWVIAKAIPKKILYFRARSNHYCKDLVENITLVIAEDNTVTFFFFIAENVADQTSDG